MPTISGITKDSTGALCSAVVDIHRRSDGKIITRVISDETTGAYSATIPDHEPYYAIRFAAPVVDENALYRRLGLHFSGDNNSIDIRDVYGHAVAVVGEAKIDAVTTDPYGGTSGILPLDGGGDRLTLASSNDFDIRTGGVSDFTIRFKFKTTQTTSEATMLCRDWGAAPYNNGLTIMLRSSTSGPLACWMTGYSTSAPILTGTTTTHGDNAWHDFEWSCSGNIHRLFLDGVIEAETTSSSVQVSALKILVIGDDPTFGGGARAYNGKMKDVEILVGKALHTSNFTPPSQTFHDSPMDDPTEDAEARDNITPI